MVTAILSSVSFMNEIANDAVCQSSLFSKYFASIFEKTFNFAPNTLPSFLPLFTDFEVSQQTKDQQQFRCSQSKKLRMKFLHLYTKDFQEQSANR